MSQILFFGNETWHTMFYSGKSIFQVVLVKKEHLAPWMIEGYKYYAKHRGREPHVTNLFLRNERQDTMFLSGKSIFEIVLVKKEHLEPWRMEGSQYYAKHQIKETHVSNPFFVKRNMGYDALEWEEHIPNCFSQKGIPRTVQDGWLPILCKTSNKGNRMFQILFF